MNFLIITVSLLFATLLQARIPYIFGIRLEFLPAIAAFGALTFTRPIAVTFAFVAGCLQDALSAGPFAMTGLMYASAAYFISSLESIFDRELPFTQMGAGALISGVTSIAASSIAGFPSGAILKIIVLAAISSMLTPLVMLLLDYFRYLARPAR